ncbi:MAG TPA: NADH-quinone oxidoreductase subunit NuoH [Desulfobacteria bacterium]|nr:NADH-quinone oxidoreductase subunit NuoH [Desulfobacteria bacterium]
MPQFGNNLFLLIASWIRSLFGGNTVTADVVMNIINFLVVLIVMVGTVCVFVMMERYVSAHMQYRVGPNRLGFRGWFQIIGDMVKLMGKEDFRPDGVDKWPWALAPMFFLGITIMAMAIIPFGKGMVPIDLNLGIFYLLAVSGLSTLPVVVAGWSSNNKYSLLGGMRAVAQMISYEIPLVFSLLGVVMITETFKTSAIVEAQSHVWFVLLQPIGFIVYVIAAMAEVNRAPFDLVEAESEFGGGYFSEYSGLRFGLFYVGEYANLFVIGAIATTVFLGGWQGPLLPGWLWFFVKDFAVVIFIMWVRWTFPRFRVDQLMNFGWKVLLPLSLANIVLTGIGIYVYQLIYPGIGG